MPYATINFRTKKALADAVKAGQVVGVMEPGLGKPPVNGTAYLEGPWYPEPHRWYAQVEVQDGRIVKVR